MAMPPANISPEQAALLGAIIGGGFTLFGTLLTGVLNICLESRRIRREAIRELRQKQIAALQKCVQLIDFLFAAKDKRLEQGGMDMWLKIRQETLSDGALFPPKLSADFAKMIREVTFLDEMDESSKVLDFDALERLRKGCIDFIHRPRW